MDYEKRYIWPEWETGRIIGKGSAAVVYEIRHRGGNGVEKAALKVIAIPGDPDDMIQMREKGYDDAQIAENVRQQLRDLVNRCENMKKLRDCPNVVRFDDVRCEQHSDGIGWDVFLKTELLTPLTRVVSDNVDEGIVIRLGKDLCRALMAGEENGILHGDIKPANIFVAPNGAFKLGDFGISGIMGGTSTFAAPEGDQTAAADLYSLGLVLYWLLNARQLPGKEAQPPANGSDRLKKIILKACAPNPGDRYRTAGEMLADLNALTGEVPVIVSTEQEDQEGESWETESQEQTDLEKERLPETDRQKKTKRLALAGLGCGVAAVLLLLLFLLPKPASEAQPTVPQESTLRTEPVQTSPVQTNPAQTAPDQTTHTHVWQEATCMAAKTCVTCGVAEGDPLEHQWTDATYERASHCPMCGSVVGKSLPYPLTWCNKLKDTNTPGTQMKDVIVGDFQDSFGNTQRDALKFWVMDRPGFNDTEYIIYDLAQGFETLEFTIAADMENHRDGTIRILLYDEDDNLLYDSGWMGNDLQPMQGFVDVAGVDTLRIECTTDFNKDCYGLFRGILYAQS